MKSGGSQLYGCTRSNDWYACLNNSTYVTWVMYDKVKHGGLFGCTRSNDWYACLNNSTYVT